MRAVLYGSMLVAAVWLVHHVPRVEVKGPPMWAMVPPRELEATGQTASDRTLRRWAKRKDQSRVVRKFERMGNYAG